MNDDRGQIKRVSFEILYPTGQLKQVHIPIGGVPKWESAGLIVWSDRLIREVVTAGLDATRGRAALDRWETLDGHFKPAMLVVSDDGTAVPFCGNHMKLGGAALWPDEENAQNPDSAR
ncbi:MAG: hypothetical protein WA484_04700 [Solirubrobacteraceae bacterium]